MIAEQIINPSITPLKPTDTVDRALQWMDELKVSHLPIIDNFQLVGLTNEVYLLDQQNLPLVETGLEFKKIACKSTDHIFDVIQLVNQYNVSTIAVLDQKNNYIGSITQMDLFTWLSNQSAYKSRGGIVVLMMQENNYSLSELSRIVESVDTKILGVSIKNDENDPARIQVILKLNKEDINRVVATFERYEYSVMAAFTQNDTKSDAQERLDNLMKYLDT